MKTARTAVNVIQEDFLGAAKAVTHSFNLYGRALLDTRYIRKWTVWRTNVYIWRNDTIAAV